VRLTRPVAQERVYGTPGRLGHVAFPVTCSAAATRAVTVAHAAADREDVTEKNPIKPGELLPACELEADLHVAAGRYAAVRPAYQATLVRELRRARRVFSAARAGELAGGRAAAVGGYREFLALMQR